METTTTITDGTAVIHRAGSRGHANHGWLDTWHSFSFANWYDPERIHFGALRVLNDDTVQAGRGFGTHPHDNMEIISLVTEGRLEHGDSMGHKGVINTGDIQVMSAGRGVQHSEYNPDTDQLTRFFQIWIFPREQDVTPRYGQMNLDPAERTNRFQQIVSPDPDDAGLWIHQDAWLHLGRFDAGRKERYAINKPGNGVYALVVEGSALVNGVELSRRDAIGIVGMEGIELITGAQGAELLLIEVPMKF